MALCLSRLLTGEINMLVSSAGVSTVRFGEEPLLKSNKLHLKKAEVQTYYSTGAADMDTNRQKGIFQRKVFIAGRPFYMVPQVEVDEDIEFIQVQGVGAFERLI